jgi:hypothetical protein
VSRIIKKAQNRLLKKRVDKRFVTPTEDVANVCVQSGGVVAVGNAAYKSETAGIKPGKIVEAVNVGTVANARYVAKHVNLSSYAIESVQATVATSTINAETSVEPVMTVTPTDNISVSDFVGGTFTGSQVYTITNIGSIALNWTIVHAWDWVDVSALSGTLAVGASTTVTVSIDEVAAAALTVGSHTDMIVFNMVAA